MLDRVKCLTPHKVALLGLVQYYVENTGSSDLALFLVRELEVCVVTRGEGGGRRGGVRAKRRAGWGGWAGWAGWRRRGKGVHAYHEHVCTASRGEGRRLTHDG